jgi:hypothetical protein
MRHRRKKEIVNCLEMFYDKKDYLYSDEFS